MADFFKCFPEGTGKNVNKKQLQNFIKELLFEKSMDDLERLEQEDCGEWPIAAAAIFKTVVEAIKADDSSKLGPVLDFAFQKDTVKAAKTRR